MKYFNILESPIKVTGLSTAAGNIFWRLPPDIINNVSGPVSYLAKNNAGGCVRFSTDSAQVEVKVKLAHPGGANHFALSGNSGVDVYFDGLFVCTARPADTKTAEYSMVMKCPSVLENGMHKVECFLPLYNTIVEMEIGIDDDARLEAAPDYKHKAVAFYGASVTQGGCASKPGNNYTAILSRWLDFEQRNLGFSGNAKGEPILARYIATLDLSAFVLDYDHSKSPESLEETHRNFFNIVRKARPELPIVIMSKGDFDPKPEENTRRRDIIFATYNEAVRNGDKRVWFVDGQTMFGPYTTRNDRRACTVDGCHPNDLGFWRMAKTVYPVLKEAIEAGEADSITK